MLKILIATIPLLLISLPAAAQLNYPEYTEQQVVTASNKVCAVLNNGRSYTLREAMFLIKLRGSLERDITGRENEYSSAEDNAQVIRNANRIVDRLNLTCQTNLSY
jgi:hypothetical protein